MFRPWIVVPLACICLFAGCSNKEDSSVYMSANGYVHTSFSVQDGGSASYTITGCGIRQGIVIRGVGRDTVISVTRQDKTRTFTFKNQLGDVLLN